MATVCRNGERKKKKEEGGRKKKKERDGERGRRKEGEKNRTEKKQRKDLSCGEILEVLFGNRLFQLWT